MPPKKLLTLKWNSLTEARESYPPEWQDVCVRNEEGDTGLAQVAFTWDGRPKWVASSDPKKEGLFVDNPTEWSLIPGQGAQYA